MTDSMLFVSHFSVASDVSWVAAFHGFLLFLISRHPEHFFLNGVRGQMLSRSGQVLSTLAFCLALPGVPFCMFAFSEDILTLVSLCVSVPYDFPRDIPTF